MPKSGVFTISTGALNWDRPGPGWHLLASKDKQLCMYHSLPYVTCSELGMYSIVLSFTLCTRTELLHFTHQNTQNNQQRVIVQEQKSICF